MNSFRKLCETVKKNWKIILEIGIGAIILLFVIPLIINALYKHDFGIEVFQCLWEAGDALMFYGSIMSGLITFLGVLLTIHHENIERRKDDTIKYKPILEVEGVNLSVNSIYREVGLGYGITIANDNPDKERIMKKFSEHQCGDYAKCRVYIRNIGRGETSNAKIEKFEVSDTNWNDISNIYSNISTPLYIGEIIPNKYIAIGIKLPQYLMLPKTNEENKCFTISTNLYINYSDMFDRIKYQYIIHMKFAIIIEKIVTDAPDVPNDEYQYVRVSYELNETIPQKRRYSDKRKEYEMI